MTRPYTLESMEPAGAAAPLGHAVADDHVDGDDRQGIVCTAGEGHRLVVGPPGSGKFTSVIKPLLLTADRASVIVYDVKNGEATNETAGHRAKLGPVAVIDPFGITDARPEWLAKVNPLDLLDPDAPGFVGRVKRLADAIFTASSDAPGTANSDYWNQSASEFLRAVLIHVVTSPSENRRTLTRVREIMRRPIAGMTDFLDAMQANPAAKGIVCDAAENLLAAIENGAESNNVYLQNALRVNTDFLDSDEVQWVTEETTIDLAAMRSRVSTLYIAVPEYELESVGRWLRLLYASTLETVRLAGLERGTVPLHIVMDEFPAFGRFRRVAADMALVRSYGIHYHVIVQSLAQLHEHYGAAWSRFLAVAKWRQVLGSNDNFTADYVSRQLGTTTRPATSSNASRSAGGGSQSAGKSWVAAPLMAAHEVNQLDPGRCLVMMEGSDPLTLRKWFAYQSDYLKSRSG